MKADLRKAAGLLALALLAACQAAKPAKTDDQRTAGGQVLPGTISEAMLPYDTTKSQPPLAPRKHAVTGDAADAAASGADSGATAVPAEPAADPAPSIAN